MVEQVGLHLGLPMARVELALRGGRRGIVTANFVSPDSRLEHGNELLVRVDPDYDRGLARQNDRYTVEAIQLALADAEPPAAYRIEQISAFDLFAGYLLLDGWVAGRDRHHENWAVVASPNERVLAPSFDHGNALGFQEPDHNRERMNNDPALLMRWAERGISHHFAGRPTLLALARRARLASSEGARDIWLTRLASVGEDELAEIVEQIPPSLMSEASRTFCMKVLMLNKRRLCDAD